MHKSVRSHSSLKDMAAFSASSGQDMRDFNEAAFYQRSEKPGEAQASTFRSSTSRSFPLCFFPSELSQGSEENLQSELLLPLLILLHPSPAQRSLPHLGDGCGGDRWHSSS